MLAFAALVRLKRLRLELAPSFETSRVILTTSTVALSAVLLLFSLLTLLEASVSLMPVTGAAAVLVVATSALPMEVVDTVVLGSVAGTEVGEVPCAAAPVVFRAAMVVAPTPAAEALGPAVVTSTATVDSAVLAVVTATAVPAPPAADVAAATEVASAAPTEVAGTAAAAVAAGDVTAAMEVTSTAVTEVAGAVALATVRVTGVGAAMSAAPAEVTGTVVTSAAEVGTAAVLSLTLATSTRAALVELLEFARSSPRIPTRTRQIVKDATSSNDTLTFLPRRPQSTGCRPPACWWTSPAHFVPSTATANLSSRSPAASPYTSTAMMGSFSPRSRFHHGCACRLVFAQWLPVDASLELLSARLAILSSSCDDIVATRLVKLSQTSVLPRSPPRLTWSRMGTSPLARVSSMRRHPIPSRSDFNMC
mmetsp:Transcript_8047/g.18001  ORF Transcript_8047/g.18001 Transcript_8047/m.18001 type:complete len:422 (+) Transcript_8047:2825-4090(+)